MDMTGPCMGHFKDSMQKLASEGINTRETGKREERLL